MKTAIFAITFVLLIAGCEDPSAKLLQSEDSGMIVVDGNITSENKNHRIIVSHPYAVQNQAATPASGATLLLSVDSLSLLLTESPAGSGYYYTPVLRSVTGKIYTLTISYQGKVFTAQDVPPAVEPMQPLTVQRVDSVYAITSGAFGSQPNFIQHQIDWSSTGSCKPGSACAGEMYFYDLKSADVNDIFKPDKENFYFPRRTTIIRRKYSVSPAYRAFLRSMLSETEWSGGLFDVQRTPVETNFSAGAIGFFAVSTIVADTTVVNGQ